VAAFELDGELFFGAEEELARHFEAMAVAARGGVRAVVLVLARGRNPDAGFLRLLRDFHESLRERGVGLVLCGVPPQTRASLASTGLVAAIGCDRICETVEGAVEAAGRQTAEDDGRRGP
jgi:MFS superfamily sulfate permease-like transporter